LPHALKSFAQQQMIPYWKSAPYWPLIYTNIAGVCTFEKFVVDSKMMSSKIIKRGKGRNGMFGKTQSDFMSQIHPYLANNHNKHRYAFCRADSRNNKEGACTPLKEK
jgi:hypothetical protein